MRCNISSMRGSSDGDLPAVFAKTEVHDQQLSSCHVLEATGAPVSQADIRCASPCAAGEHDVQTCFRPRYDASLANASAANFWRRWP